MILICDSILQPHQPFPWVAMTWPSGADSSSATHTQGFCCDKVSPTLSRSSRDLTPSHGYMGTNAGLPIEYVGAEDNHIQAVSGSARSLPPSSPGDSSPPASSLDSESAVDGSQSVFKPTKGNKPSPGPPARSEFRLHCRICRRDPCEDMTATIHGHPFCKRQLYWDQIPAMYDDDMVAGASHAPS